ncbi:hypothetical protein COCNU_12G004390 [Cocos nucifera]|uniref:Uncharacterized protein n=1 Tax=Cocos nucifera TaxID=13894 RepID=A0A8K0IR54_COCNU|nr:hypothetical protein COCNU_12G004390 [Cocos nucifera]
MYETKSQDGVDKADEQEVEGVGKGGSSGGNKAPVSDREYRATLPETAVMIDLAVKMINEGRGMELMPREANPDAPITAYRYHSLCAYTGDDDMFSSDLSEDQLRLRLGHMSSTPCQVIFSMDDENVPDYVDKKALVESLHDPADYVRLWEVPRRLKLNGQIILSLIGYKKQFRPS